VQRSWLVTEAFSVASVFTSALFGTRCTTFYLGPIGSKTLRQRAGFPCAHLSPGSSTRRLTYSVAFYSRFEEQTGFEIDLSLIGPLSADLISAGLSSLRRDAPTARGSGYNDLILF